MRILLVGNYEPDAQQSMQRYAHWLERVLADRGHMVTVARPEPFFSRLAPPGSAAKYLGYLDKFILFPPHLRRVALKHDIVHILDHSNSMYLRTARRAPSLITCHDVLAIRSALGDFPGFPTGWSGRLLQRWILSGLRRAKNVICVSAKTRSDLIGLIGETGARIRVVPNALTWNYRPVPAMPEDLANRLNLTSGATWFLHVGGNQWYKNRVGVVRIFSELARRNEFASAKLVLAGKPWTRELHSEIAQQGLADRAIQAKDLTNDELAALYSHAQALLFPSLEEGFGWPIVEAQACGCPVITTNRPPMSEVAGEAAILIDPADPAAAAAAICGGLQRRDALRAAGFRNVERYSESSIARQYCAIYEEILGIAASAESEESTGAKPVQRMQNDR